MTLSFVGYINAKIQSNSPVNVTLPGGSVAGDLVALIMTSGVGDTSLPSGFTALDGPTASDSGEVRSSWKALTGTDISNNYVTMPGSPSFNDLQCSMWVLHSTTGTATIDGHSSRQGNDGTNPTVYNSGTITTVNANAFICVAFGGRGGSAPTAWSSTPGGVTIDQNLPTNYIHTLTYHYSFTGPGVTTDQTASLDSQSDREHAAVVGVSEPAALAGSALPRYAPDFKTRRRLAYRVVDTGQIATGRMAVTLGAFTMVASGSQNAAVRGTVWMKTLTGAGGAETFTASAAVEVAAAYMVLHGAIALDQSATTSAISDVSDSPSVTTSAADELVIWGHFRDAASITVTPGTGTTVGPVQSSATATRTSIAANYQAQAVAGVSGARRFAGAAANSWAAATVSVTPAPPSLVTGTIAVTLAPFTMAASGTYTTSITGTIAVTLAPFVMAATGNVTIGGTAPTLVGDLTSSPYLPEANSSPRWD